MSSPRPHRVLAAQEIETFVNPEKHHSPDVVSLSIRRAHGGVAEPVPKPEFHKPIELGDLKSADIVDVRAARSPMPARPASHAAWQRMHAASLLGSAALAARSPRRTNCDLRAAPARTAVKCVPVVARLAWPSAAP